MRRIDSHTHFDAIDDPRVVALMEKHGVSTVSWAYMRHRPKTLSAVAVYFEDQHRTCAAGQGQGVRVHRLVGIHPRSIPESYVTVEDIRADDIQAVLEDAVRMIRQHRRDAHRIMINSDSMAAGPEEYHMFLKVWEYLDEETMTVAGETATVFFGL